MATTSENTRPGAAEGDGSGSQFEMNEDSVGTVLRRAREAQGSRPVAEIAEEIRVRPHQLEALEADDYDRLPGLIYAAGFIRAYAQYLGLDSQELVSLFKRTARTEDLEAHLAFPEPLEDPRIPRRSLVAIACTLAIAVYGTWYGFSSREETGFEDVPTVESRLAGVVDDTDATRPETVAPVSAPVGADAARPAQVKNEPVKIAQSDPAPHKRPLVEPQEKVEPEAVETPVASAIEPEPVMDAMDPAPAPEPAAVVTPVTDNGQITVRARQDAWVRIEGPGATPVMDRVLKAGEAYDAPAGRGLYMMTGNAGALDIMVDGKHVGSLGPRGAIRRHVALDSTLLRTASAVQQE